MMYILFDNVVDADERSRAGWAATLGRQKNPQDVTTFLWGVYEPPDKSSALLCVAEGTESKLDTVELTKLKTAADSSIKSVLDKAFRIGDSPMKGSDGNSPKGNSPA